MWRYSAMLLVCGAFCAAATDVKVVEEIVAKVNNEIITRGELDRERKQAEARFRAQGLSGQRLADAMKEFEKGLLRDRVDNMLLVQKGKELSINVDSDVSKFLADMQLRSKIGDPEKFQQMIREQLGMPFEDYKAELRNQYLTRRVIGQEVSSRIHVPQAEVQKYYAEHKTEFVRKERVFLQEILISTQGKKPEEASALEKKAKGIVARARKGEKFDNLVRDFSEADSAQNGGFLDPYERGSLDKRIEDLVFIQGRNYVTDPIRVSGGFLILKVVEKHNAGQATLEEVEDEINNKLFMPRFEPEIRKFLTRLRMDAFLEIKEGYTDTAAAPGKDTRWRDPAMLKPATVTKEEVANRTRHRRLLWLIPIPGTKVAVKTPSSSKG
ncbi:MAG: peptidyl-prolyl cis-trans isomerase [Acidobacteriales bacterium]|nr:peptidyl-prolyl cis-trans isomerase [Terriglobales bacterium]